MSDFEAGKSYLADHMKKEPDFFTQEREKHEKKGKVEQETKTEEQELKQEVEHGKGTGHKEFRGGYIHEGDKHEYEAAFMLGEKWKKGGFFKLERGKEGYEGSTAVFSLGRAVLNDKGELVVRIGASDVVKGSTIEEHGHETHGEKGAKMKESLRHIVRPVIGVGGKYEFAHEKGVIEGYVDYNNASGHIHYDLEATRRIMKGINIGVRAKDGSMGPLVEFPVPIIKHTKIGTSVMFPTTGGPAVLGIDARFKF